MNPKDKVKISTIQPNLLGEQIMSNCWFAAVCEKEHASRGSDLSLGFTDGKEA